MEFFKDANIDFLGKKWYLLAFSLVFSVAGLLSMLFWHGIPLGVDFRGGTLVYVKFAHAPDTNSIRASLERAGLKADHAGQIGAAAARDAPQPVPGDQVNAIDPVRRFRDGGEAAGGDL